MAFLNNLLFKAGNLITSEVQIKVPNADLTALFHVLCFHETWLTKEVQNFEVMSGNFQIYRAHRPPETDVSPQPFRRDSLLDIAPHRFCFVNAEPKKNIAQVYHYTDHGAVSILVECPDVDAKPITRNFRRFGNQHYAQTNEMMTTEPFEATC